jgi:hypothetical protein
VGGAGPARPFSIGGKRYEGGIGARSGSENEYDVLGIFATFSALVGIDDGYNGAGTIAFTVVGDGKELWNSGAVKKSDGPKPVTVNIAGVKRLILRATAAGEISQGQNMRSGPESAWINAKIAGRSGLK